MKCIIDCIDSVTDLWENTIIIFNYQNEINASKKFIKIRPHRCINNYNGETTATVWLRLISNSEYYRDAMLVFSCIYSGTC